MKKIIVWSFVVFFLSIVSVSVATTGIKEKVIHDAGEQIALKMNKKDWIIVKIFAPIEKIKIVETNAMINGEIKTVKMAECSQYFRFKVESKPIDYYEYCVEHCVAKFSFHRGKWRLSAIWLLNQTLLDEDPELFWELHDLEPFEF